MSVLLCADQTKKGMGVSFVVCGPNKKGMGVSFVLCGPNKKGMGVSFAVPVVILLSGKVLKP